MVKQVNYTRIFVCQNIFDSKAFLFLSLFFVGVLNFCLTEGPFIHSPTLWQHLEFHLTPPPCTFWDPLLTQTGDLIMWPLSISTVFLHFFFFLPASSVPPPSDFDAKYILITRSVDTCVKVLLLLESLFFFISLWTGQTWASWTSGESSMYSF